MVGGAVLWRRKMRAKGPAPTSGGMSANQRPACASLPPETVTLTARAPGEFTSILVSMTGLPGWR
jgi:hypothetical protein